ncbi:MAG: 50S ribosomal protein L24 [Candidatus ainarchaeum sp.]|nr:50S ribosomal protein L24 [Candidatus ainarchaeum sp.]MDD3085764.1 50S ribosomal protein L24 [Candidatus ainarchaeum sp.]MDD4128497.1 50S ribosomal protein L24 [Candidatus ainarchaeum sp.]MDD4467975.1 50S ribosomal protein L24 [Candidatus ainarchaeum sp.]
MSKKPSKSRKAFYTMPKHKAVKVIASHLDEKLANELKKRSISVRKGDTVKIVRGENKGKEGKISSVDTVKKRMYIEKVVVRRSNGQEKPLAIQPSNVIVIDLDRSDRKRFKTITKKEAKK